MKRCLFVCLFVCAMSLVNVANADYLPWSSVEPDDVIWKTATVTVDKNDSVSITGGIGFENVNVYDYFSYSIDAKKGYLTIYLKDAGLQNSAYLEFKRTPDSAANGHQGLVKVGTQSEKWNASVPTENPRFLTATGNSLIESIYVEYQSNSNFMPFTFEVSFSGTRNEEGDVDTTPEPASMLIFGLGLAGLGLCRRMRKK